MTQTPTQKSLYDQDMIAWCEDTVAKLKARKFDEIDIENLIEEIQGLANRDKRELKNRLEVLIYHLLKRLYVNLPNDYRGWKLNIREQRRQIKSLLEQSPSLRQYFEEVFPKVYENARSDAQEDYSQTQFPEVWMFGSEVDVLLNEKFWESEKK